MISAITIYHLGDISAISRLMQSDPARLARPQAHIHVQQRLALPLAPLARREIERHRTVPRRRRAPRRRPRRLLRLGLRGGRRLLHTISATFAYDLGDFCIRSRRLLRTISATFTYDLAFSRSDLERSRSTALAYPAGTSSFGGMYLRGRVGEF